MWTPYKGWAKTMIYTNTHQRLLTKTIYWICLIISLIIWRWNQDVGCSNRISNGFIKHYTCHSSLHSPSLWQKTFVGNSKQNQWQVTRSADSDFDLLADDSVNGFTWLIIASKKDDICRGVQKIHMVQKTSSRKFWKWCKLKRKLQEAVRHNFDEMKLISLSLRKKHGSKWESFKLTSQLKVSANAHNNTQHCWAQQCCLLLRDVSRCVQTLATSHNMLGL